MAHRPAPRAVTNTTGTIVSTTNDGRTKMTSGPNSRIGRRRTRCSVLRLIRRRSRSANRCSAGSSGVPEDRPMRSVSTRGRRTSPCTRGSARSSSARVDPPRKLDQASLNARPADPSSISQMVWTAEWIECPALVAINNRSAVNGTERNMSVLLWRPRGPLRRRPSTRPADRTCREVPIGRSDFECSRRRRPPPGCSGSRSRSSAIRQGHRLLNPQMRRTNSAAVPPRITAVIAATTGRGGSSPSHRACPVHLRSSGEPNPERSRERTSRPTVPTHRTSRARREAGP